MPLTADIAAMAAEQDPRLKPSPKRIIICCDGTWQSSVSGKQNTPSNMTRLVRNLAKVGLDDNGKAWQQIVWYDSGVGTTSGFLDVVYEGAVGAGLEGNVIEAYNFVVANYVQGDKIYCFGFSRGAYTARTIAGLISDIGICVPDDLHHFHEIWAAYKANDTGERFYPGSQVYWDFFDGTLTESQPDGSFATGFHSVWGKYDVDIEVVGVFDTVGAIGFPSLHGYHARLPFGPDKTGFHNVRLNRNIRRAFHALALDEHREAFSPTLWHLPEQIVSTQEEASKQLDRADELRIQCYRLMTDPNVPLATRQEALRDWQKAKMKYHVLQQQTKPPSSLKQVWFPGVHINAGGGSRASLLGKGDLEELSTIAFVWMVDQITPYLTVDYWKFYKENENRDGFIREINNKISAGRERIAADKEGYKHSSIAQRYSRLFHDAAGALKHPFTSQNGGDLHEKSYDWGTGEIIDSCTLMYRIGNGEKLRTPGQSEHDPKGNDPGDTFEEIHPTVGYRMKMTEDANEKQRYYPAGQKHVERRRNREGSWEYTFGGKALLEYKMAPLDSEKPPEKASFERLVVLTSGDRARKYVEELDKGN